MKKLTAFDQFIQEKTSGRSEVNEKVFRLSAPYSAKGLVGKIMQGFKKTIAKFNYEGDDAGLFKDVNKAWDKFKPTAHKLVLAQVKKATKNMDGVAFVSFKASAWTKADDLSKSDGESINIKSGEVVINVGFADDADAGKSKRKFDKEAMQNSPIVDAKDLIYGEYSGSVGDNNLELRGSEVMLVEK